MPLNLICDKIGMSSENGDASLITSTDKTDPGQHFLLEH